MARATDDTLSELHKKLAQAFLQAIDNKDEAVGLLIEYPDLPVPVKLFLERVGIDNPALLTAATKFLKDNQITAVIDDSEETSELERRLKNKRMRTADVIPLEA